MTHTLRNIVLASVATLMLGGCTQYWIRESEYAYETAVVSSKNHSSSIEPSVGVSITNQNGGIGIGSNGVGFGIGGLNFSISDSEEYNITFNGKIDFNVDNERLYNRFNIGDTVDVKYAEEYFVLYKRINGKKIAIKRELAATTAPIFKPRFINAELEVKK